MDLKNVRRILKTFADDTRLRIINILSRKELTVNDLCNVLKKNQSNISKHLTRLRLTDIVEDRREGLNVYYYLKKPGNKYSRILLDAVTSGISDINAFVKDAEKLNKI
ncbi:MAG: winged helix-turn-helix transcriptional regulator [Spirochaetes bacterium]|nr:winged helix-turn-helix transcriptional regulator [Spirochaetota bacterium]